MVVFQIETQASSCGYSTSTNDCERLENDIAGFFTNHVDRGNNEETRNKGKTCIHYSQVLCSIHAEVAV